MPQNAARFDLVLDVSDTLVFDYLVDGALPLRWRGLRRCFTCYVLSGFLLILTNSPDHDRLKSQNWEYGAGSPLLLWDSGLAWVHGPRGYSEDKERSLLCGPEWWRGEGSRTCNSICRFSAELVSRVETLGTAVSGR